MISTRCADTQMPGEAPSRRRGAVTALLGVVAVGLFTALLLAFSAELPGTSHEARAAAGKRGIIDWRLEKPEGVRYAELPTVVGEMGRSRLRAGWTRVYARWQRLQPLTGLQGDANRDGIDDSYDLSYVAELDTVIRALHDQGIRVIVTGLDVPRWASDQRYWVAGQFDTDVVMRIGDPVVRNAWQNLARFLAARWPGKADHFEVWNEPNLGSAIYPQIVGKKVVGPAAYLGMLKAFYRGAKQGNRKAVVIAGATSRRGANDKHSTSPQYFAKYLKTHGALKYLNAYSHHPYTPPGSKPSPTALPQRPKIMVTLGNLNVLLKIFPRTPFYLTEYGYSTGTKDLFCVTVSPADQARYMRQAYAMVQRKPQIKALLWFLVTDYEPYQGEPDKGIYSGLIRTDATRKPAWFAFAGGNSITRTMPRTARSGAAFSISGTLSTRLGSLAGEKLSLQSRRPTGRVWKTVATATTVTGGAYSFSRKQSRTMVYRVVWGGVCESRAATVRTR